MSDTPASSTLSGRRRAILKIIVQEHVATAHPVASTTIARGYDLGVSSATIRNEMAVLEEEGYIYGLHTSAGRVPSEKGYRFFVEHLMDEVSLTGAEQRTIAHQFHQAHLELGQWLRLAAAVLAQSVRNAAVVTAPRSSQTRFKHLELIAIQDSLALLVAVFDGGTVQQQMFVPIVSVTQDELSAVAARLNRAIEGRTAAEFSALVARSRIVGSGPIEMQAFDLVTRMIRELDEQSTVEVFVDGLGEVLAQPEFSGVPRSGGQDASSARQVVQLMQQGLLFNQLIHQLSTVDGMQVIIGGDGTWEEMRPVSLVLSRYGNPAIGGLLGVLGPTRMHYGRAVAVVRFVSTILGDMATELGGHA